MGMQHIVFSVDCLTLSHSWVRTGDSVVINEDGELFVVDRVKVCLSWFLK
jgi:acyl-CoA synthetase (AMP-forming)/AMP-acid ligase II